MQSKIDIGDSIGEFYEHNNEFNIDITDLSKKWILGKTNQLENQGITIESIDNSLIILISNDNPCYINKTIIMIK